MIIVGLGRMSKEQKGMVFTGEEVPQKIYHQGEGCILADGYPLMEIYYPRITNVVDWKKHIKEILKWYAWITISPACSPQGEQGQGN